MPHANIWIRRQNQGRWDAIDDKSAWVNAMLKESAPSRSTMLAGNEAPYPASDIFKKESVGKDDRDYPVIKPLAHPWEPVDEDTTLKAVKELHRQQNNPRFSGAIASCKIHGIPLDARGRCMQKGCRYG